MVDKYVVKKYVADKIGEEYIIPTLGVWNKPEDINFDRLPNQFVLKCTHDSGTVIICKDKSKFDIENARKKLKKYLNQNYYLAGREWPYKNVSRRIIAEQYMKNTTTHELRDYKFFTFDGVAKALFIATERQNLTTDTKFDFFDMEYQHLDFTNGYPNAKVPTKKSEKFEEMRRLAEKLSQGIPHVRVDFYEINGKVYFGELTFSHWSGMVPFDSPKWDKMFGDWISIPNEYGGGKALIANDIILWLHQKTSTELTDYKFMCFNGEVKCSFTCTERFSESGLKVTFFDRDWKKLPFVRHYPRSEKDIPRPQNYELMLQLAEKLSHNIPFVRVDFYEINGRVYFGELTFYPGAGFEKFRPETYDKKLGSWINIPNESGGNRRTNS